MKKLRSILTGALALCMAFTMTACGNSSGDASGDGSPGAADGADAVKIGIALPTSQEEIWVVHGDNLQKCAQELGYETIVQVANGDTDKQFSQIENLLTNDIDVLILAACDPGATSNMVARASEEGVKVIGYDRVWAGDPYDLYLTFDNVAVGRLMAEFAVEKAPEGNYTLLGGDVVNQPATDEIHQGWMEVLQEYVDSGKITIAADQNCKNWASDEGLAHMENALTASKNQMAAVLCANDGIAGGAIQALDSAGLVGSTIVTGQDSEVAAAQRIVAGRQSITLYKDSHDLAKATIEAAGALAKGENVNTSGDYEGIPMITVPPTVVQKENLDEILIDSGYMSKEEVYS